MKNMLPARALVGVVVVLATACGSFAEEVKPPMLPVMRLASSGQAQREAALAEAVAARKESIRVAVSIIESWERVRAERVIVPATQPAEYVSLRLLVELRAVEALPVLMRNITVVDKKRDPSINWKRQPLLYPFPFAEAIAELGVPRVTPLLDFIGKTRDPNEMLLAVGCLRAILRRELASAAIEQRIREAGGPGSADAKPFVEAKKLHDAPGGMPGLY